MKMNVKKQFQFPLLIIACFGLIILCSCGAADMGFAEDSMMVRGLDAEDHYQMESPEMIVGEKQYGRVDYEETVTNKSRHFIQTGSMNITVKSTHEAISSIRNLAEQTDSIVSNLSLYEARENQFAANVTLRIPAEKFDSMVEKIQALGKYSDLNTNINDVTMEYVDLESRLNNQIAQEKRLVEILEMAENVEEVLEVERELYRVRGEIESMTGRLNYLKDQVSYSTLNIYVKEEAIPTTNVSGGAFDNIGQRIREAFTGSINFILHAISSLIVILSALLPVMIILTVIGAITWIIVKRVTQKNKAT